MTIDKSPEIKIDNNELNLESEYKEDTQENSLITNKNRKKSKHQKGKQQDNDVKTTNEKLKKFGW